MTDKLKPCPFCGGEAEILHESVGKWYVRCKKCWCRTKVNPSEMFAIVDWNTRRPMDRIVEQLEKATEGVKEKANTLPEIESAGFLCGWLALKAAIKIVKGVQNE